MNPVTTAYSAFKSILGTTTQKSRYDHPISIKIRVRTVFHPLLSEETIAATVRLRQSIHESDTLTIKRGLSNGPFPRDQIIIRK